MAEKCSLCEDYVVTDKCGVGEKGIDGLIKASIARKDGKHELFRGQKKIVLHASCRKKYTRPQSITRDLKIAVLDGQPLTSSSTPCLRSSQLEFDFKSHLEFAVKVMKRSGGPYFSKKDIASAHRSLMFHGNPSNDHGKITGIPPCQCLHQHSVNVC
ncbi:hypothetical protein AVEN_16795-1 [Araneus ventricosus]|uniref:Uncharacterized protein n=1 Tax=Araneus ventricosus TaxID=182803 RepID=A0A4Y2BPY2_ARAVE|nr:hypothetical protein AVEN_16795-1 [Araneus ventricosus]